jgi:hypothetical protein
MLDMTMTHKERAIRRYEIIDEMIDGASSAEASKKRGLNPQYGAEVAREFVKRGWLRRVRDGYTWTTDGMRRRALDEMLAMESLP